VKTKITQAGHKGSGNIMEPGRHASHRVVAPMRMRLSISDEY